MQLMKVIDSFGIQYLHQSEKLKNLLCPVVAKTAAEQDRFYKIFDQYIQEAKLVPNLEGESATDSRFPNWLWLLLLPLLIGLAAYGIYKFFKKDVIIIPEDAIIYHQQEKETAQLGETIKIFNKSNNPDSLELDFQWELLDASTGKVEKVNTETYDWEFTLNEVGTSPYKKIRLIGINEATNKRDTSILSELTIVCANPPQIEDFDPPAQIDNDTELLFRTASLDKRSYNYEWNFGEEIIQNQKTAHRFRKTGTYDVFVRASIEAEGVCETIIQKTISVGSVKPPMAFKTLQKDKIAPIAVIGEGTWILIGLIWLSMFWYLYNKFKKERNKPDEKAIQEQQMAQQFSAPSNGPYFIPFRPQNKYIKSEQSLYIFANVLRQRQQGTRELIDIPGTLKSTIEQGGFPNVQTRFDETPSEYLFLIDEQADISLQAKLFDYLVEFNQSNDVLIERFWYKDEFRRFWNSNHSEGITLEVLLRKYNHYRLVIMGQAHSMLDAFAQDEPKLNKTMVDIFSKWKDRLLFTPLPPVSWTFREAVLYRLFSIYPADIEGIEDAFQHDFKERVENLHPAYEDWKKQLSQLHQHPDVNYRKWRRTKDYKKYFENHPTLYTWFCALMVYPNPTWETTIAIGHSLAPVGVEVTYDNLLILSHIPFLKGENIKPSLRRNLLDDLDKKSLHLARTAVKAELEAVQDQTQHSHANLESQTNLAIQNFALEPQNPEYKRQIRYLIDEDLFNKKQVEELNWEVNRKKKPLRKGMVQKEKTIQDVLGEEAINEAPEKEKPSPLFIALAGSWLIPLILLIFALLVNKTDWLYKAAFGEERMNVEKESSDELRHLGLVKEVINIDSAAIYNNMAVEINKKAIQEIDKEDIDIKWNSSFQETKNLLNKVVNLKPDYTLGKNNFDKSKYNLAALQYLQYRSSTNFDFLQKAKGQFPTASGIDSIRLDALHGEGIVSYYAIEKKDSSILYYNMIDREQENYFDNIQDRPHLKDLLKDSLGFTSFEGKVIDAFTRQPVTDVSIANTITRAVRSNPNGIYFIELPNKELPSKLRLIIKKEGYREQQEIVQLEKDKPIRIIALQANENILTFNGKVIDRLTQQAIPNVDYFSGGENGKTNELGEFKISFDADKSSKIAIGLSKNGYVNTENIYTSKQILNQKNKPIIIELPKGGIRPNAPDTGVKENAPNTDTKDNNPPTQKEPPLGISTEKFTIKIGETASIQLEQNPYTGNEWVWEWVNEKEIDIVVQTVSSPQQQQQTQQSQTGPGSTAEWFFEGVQPGTQTVELALRKPNEPANPAQIKKLEIIVLPNENNAPPPRSNPPMEFFVYDENKNPLRGVAVTGDNIYLTTDFNGYAKLPNDLPNEVVKLKFEALGYQVQYIETPTSSPNNTQTIILKAGSFDIDNPILNYKNPRVPGLIIKLRSQALLESDRTGIPTSILLAQAMIATDYGTNPLAEANNMFALECGDGWNGKSIEYSTSYSSGRPRCYRSYDNQRDSFRDYTNYLTNGSRSSQYGFLFKIDQSDYQSWAEGLQKAGFSDDPDYAQKLIEIIEANNLQEVGFKKKN